MRGREILSSIAWSDDVHPDTIKEIQEAILDLDRRVHGTNQPTFEWPEVHRRLSNFITTHGGYRTAAQRIGISKSFLYDVHCGTRPYTAAILHAIGLQRLTQQEKFVPVG